MLHHRNARALVDDAVDFFEGKGVYHAPYFHDGKYYVAAEQFTEKELVDEMIRILQVAQPDERLPPREERLTGYYFGPLVGSSWPDMIAVEESACGEPRFFCKYHDGSSGHPCFPRPRLHAGKTIHLPDKKCGIRGCANMISGRIKIGLFTSMDMCTDHAQTIAAGDFIPIGKASVIIPPDSHHRPNASVLLSPKGSRAQRPLG